jgi:hypothetical protein
MLTKDLTLPYAVTALFARLQSPQTFDSYHWQVLVWLTVRLCYVVFYEAKQVKIDFSTLLQRIVDQ